MLTPGEIQVLTQPRMDNLLQRLEVSEDLDRVRGEGQAIHPAPIIRVLQCAESERSKLSFPKQFHSVMTFDCSCSSINEYSGMCKHCHCCGCCNMEKQNNQIKVDHKEALHKYYDDIMTAIRCAGQNTMKMRNEHKGNNFNLPGWKEFASDLYSMSRDLYFMWKDSGSPRQGELFNMKNRAKARFKGAMRFIRCNEDALRKDSLAKKLLCKNDKAFWKEIKLMNNSKLSLPNVIDGVTGSNNIVNMWKSHYEDLFNCLAKDTKTNGLCQNVEYDLDVEVSHPEVTNAIKELSDNKSCGLDGIHAEHLKHCSDILIPLLSKCFTGLLVHGTLPESMIDVVLVPIVKNKRASICSKANYRPIALASIVSKIFEKLLYDRISYALTTCSNQFGFKTKHSTDMCIYAFKEAVLKYRSLNSNVYSCFLDASKAFDRVNHYVLFDKLLKRGVPLYVVRILIFWYTSQTMYVRWNNVISSGFGVSNGVRQGGILSPYLFCVYMDDLSIKLNDIKVGCTIGTTLINHLMYADD